jgi:outer membrane protein assembly factor BamB
MIINYNKEGIQTATHGRPAADICAGRRLPGGDTVFVTAAPEGPNCFRLDAGLKEVGKGVTIGRQRQGVMTGMDVVGEDKILIGEPDKVVEYELSTGKAGWKHAIQGPTSVQRLANGNTLVASLGLNLVQEVDPAGEVVWEYRAKDGRSVGRAYRR